MVPLLRPTGFTSKALALFVIVMGAFVLKIGADLVARGSLLPIGHSGALGLATFLYFGLMVPLTPFAALQLARRKPVGLVGALVLFAMGTAYFSAMSIAFGLLHIQQGEVGALLIANICGLAATLFLIARVRRKRPQ